MSYTRTTWSDGSTALSAEHFNNIEDGIEEAFEKAQGNSDMWSYIRNLVYPVGSIYMSVNNTNPGTLFGGTWVAWGSGRVPVGVDTSNVAFDSVEETGGNADAIVPSHSHTATFTGNAVAGHTHTGPSHSHSINAQSISVSGSGSGTANSAGSHTHAYFQVALNTFKESGSDTEHQGISSGSTGYVGASGTHSHNVTVSVTASGTLAAHDTNSAGTGATGSAGGHTPSGSVSVASAGSSAANANLQPYITCYMWKRTA